jgi:hypothetical protein
MNESNGEAAPLSACIDGAGGGEKSGIPNGAPGPSIGNGEPN